MGNTGSSSTKVREFSISGQKLKLDNAADVSEYVKQLNKAKGLEIVNFSGNTLGLEACKALAAALAGHITLQEVNISDCFTGRLKEDVPPAIEAFGRVLADKPNLRIVDFSDNAFSPAGAKALSYFLANCISLQELRLNNNGLGPEGGKIIANGLVENRKKTVGKASSLRRVTIGRNRLENGSATELAQAFKLHEDLEDVALYQNGIRPEGIVALAEGLSHCHKLRSLDLQDNTFSDSGSQAIAKVILSWPELLRLNVGDCLVGDRGCRAILEQLVKSPAASKLTHLNLQYAEMESETAKYFASVLPSFLALESLQLNGNCFAADGAEVEAVKSSLKGMNKEAILDELDDMDFEEDSEEEESEEESEEEVVHAVVPAKVEQVVVPVEEEIVVVAKEEELTEEQVQPKAEEAEALAEVTDIIESLTIEDNGMEVTEAETVIEAETEIIKDEEHMEESVIEEVVITEPEQQLDSAKEAEESPKEL